MPDTLLTTAGATLATAGAPEPADREVPATVGHGRYLLGELLGFGGFGQVHRAHDRLTGEAVAVKLVPALSPAELARSRRELAALRWLRLPGVVRLRDDGVEGPTWFMVMDLVEGRPFGAVEPPGGWLGPTLGLLEVLARVHLAGVLHLDLKPANVLVTPAGRVVVLDFGVARGRAVPAVAIERVEGTPAWMAPEQRRGGPCDARTDLYAVGRLLLPLLPALPPTAEPVVRALAADDPDARPGSALEAYAALAGRSPFPRALARPSRWTRRELRALFGGPDRFTHDASDAAALLWRHTAGDPERVRSTAERWLLSGAASWDADALRVDRSGVERLRGGLERELAAGAPREVVGRAIRTARGLRGRGRLDAAAALLDAVAPWVDDAPDLAPAFRAERVLAALATERPDAAELALYALERGDGGPDVPALLALVRLARATLRGEAAAAAALAADAPPLRVPELEIWRQGLRVQAARLRGTAEEAAALAALRTWASRDRHRRAKLTGWRGNHLYRLGRFRQAATAHERASAHKRGVERVSSIVNAASAWLEVPDLPRAERWAREAARRARHLRHPTFEALGTWLVRTAAYRQGRPLPVDVALVEEAAALKPYLGALFAATDAATAFRQGERAACAALARRAADGFASASLRPAALLARALAAFAAPGGPDRDALARLAEEANGCPVPDLELQVLALARWAHRDPPEGWLARARAAAAARPPEHHRARLDVLSVAEALAAAPPPPWGPVAG